MPPMAELLYTPDQERRITTNVWAFMHWLRFVQGIDLADWNALQRWSVDDGAAFTAAVIAFARMPDTSTRMVRVLADTLLHGDLRPDDKVLVVGAAFPWAAARQQGTAIVTAQRVDPLAAAAKVQASVLVAPAEILAQVAFRRPGGRPDLANLATIISTGGPMSPEARRRIYTWVKADVMLLARSGDTYWGNPLEPVLARPAASPALLTPPPSAPVTP